MTTSRGDPVESLKDHLDRIEKWLRTVWIKTYEQDETFQPREAVQEKPPK
jgi:hypothetical protein